MNNKTARNVTVFLRRQALQAISARPDDIAQYLAFSYEPPPPHEAGPPS